MILWTNDILSLCYLLEKNIATYPTNLDKDEQGVRSTVGERSGRVVEEVIKSAINLLLVGHALQCHVVFFRVSMCLLHGSYKCKREQYKQNLSSLELG